MTDRTGDQMYSTQAAAGKEVSWTPSEDMFPGYSLMVERYAAGSNYRTELMEESSSESAASPPTPFQSPAIRTCFPLTEFISVQLYDLSPIPSAPSSERLDAKATEASPRQPAGPRRRLLRRCRQGACERRAAGCARFCSRHLRVQSAEG